MLDDSCRDDMNSHGEHRSSISNNSPKDLSRPSFIDSHSASLKVPSSAPLTMSGSYVSRPNQVSTVMLHDVEIVCLYIDGRQRLCLAQISNTLLKQYSYNEIHNRRVALGITCVQCTPVQLEILRRAGAMPISSRRCGMITMREAERLVKSFLEDNLPPKLPDNFSFHVKHECGWGCDGQFEPSRYNSSRAKCIKCNMCNMYFSPNKFIFHFHRTSEAKYSHPDAANFNSWRRHLKLASENDNENVMHAWEDVKAMFNGGSRKRISATPRSKEYHPPSVDSSKKPRISNSEFDLSKQMYPSPYTAFTFLSQPRKPYPFPQMNHTAPPIGFGLPYNGECQPDSSKVSNIQTPSWMGLHGMLPTYNFLWNSPFNNIRHAMRNPVYPLKENISKDTNDMAEKSNDEESSSSAGNSPTYDEKNERFSAFRLVSKQKSFDKNDVKLDSNVKDNMSDENEDIDITDDLSEPVRDSPSASPAINITDDVMTDNTEQDKYSENEDIEKGSEDTAETDRCRKEETIHENDSEKSKMEQINAKPDRSSYDQEIHNVHEKTTDSRKPPSHGQKVTEMTKEEIRQQIQVEMDIRRQMEREIQTLKDAMANELEQERQVRFSLQHKLKEAHDALHNFSCKMLASRQCDECTYKDDEETQPQLVTQQNA